MLGCTVGPQQRSASLPLEPGKAALRGKEDFAGGITHLEVGHSGSSSGT